MLAVFPHKLLLLTDLRVSDSLPHTLLSISLPTKRFIKQTAEPQLDNIQSLLSVRTLL